MMIVAIAVPVSIAACNKSAKPKFSRSSPKSLQGSHSYSVSTNQMPACGSGS